MFDTHCHRDQAGSNEPLSPAGCSLPEFLDNKPSADLDARWGEPTLFLTTAYESRWGPVGEVRSFRR